MCVCVCVCVCDRYAVSIPKQRVCVCEIVMLSVYQNKCGYETIILPLCDMQMRLSAVNRLKCDG